MKRILLTILFFSLLPISWSYAQCNDTAIEVYLESAPIIRYDETFPFEFCRQQLPLILVGNKDGGVFRGTGTVQDSIFNPVTGTGDFNLRYEVDGCPDYFFTITLEEVSIQPELNPYPPQVQGSFVCINAAPFTITGNVDDNASVVINESIYSNEFDPAFLGEGLHQIDYFYTDPVSQCIITVTDNIKVENIPNMGIANLQTHYCLTDLPERLRPTEETQRSKITGPGVSSLTGIFSPAEAGVGTHLITHHYEDFSGVCEVSEVFTIEVRNIPNISIASLGTNCYTDTDTIVYDGEALPDSVELSWHVDEAIGTYYQQGDQLIVNWNSPGEHIVELSLANTTCASTYLPRITKEGVEAYIDAQDQVVKSNTSVTLPVVGQSTDPTSNLSYNWSPSTGLSCIDCSAPVALIEETTVYSVTVTDDNGCAITDSIALTLASGDVFVPNAFTPNGDGRNDVLEVMGSGIASGNFTIFDRWGTKMYQTDDLNQGWDATYQGRVVNPGTFFYILEVTFQDGTQQQFKGNATVIR